LVHGLFRQSRLVPKTDEYASEPFRSRLTRQDDIHAVPADLDAFYDDREILSELEVHSGLIAFARTRRP
jgi:hypothetical protein